MISPLEYDVISCSSREPKHVSSSPWHCHCTDYTKYGSRIKSDAQLDYSKTMSQCTLKFTLKLSYMFRFYNHHQGANFRALLKQRYRPPVLHIHLYRVVTCPTLLPFRYVV